MKILYFLLIVVLAYGVGYLLSVGSVWLFQWLINQIFHTSFDYNIWLSGILFYLVYLLFNPNTIVKIN